VQVSEELCRLPTAVFGNKIKYIYFRHIERLASLCYTVIVTYRTLSAKVAQRKNCPFGVNSTTELKNVATTCDNTMCNTETLFSCLCAKCHATRRVFFYLPLRHWQLKKKPVKAVASTRHWSDTNVTDDCEKLLFLTYNECLYI